MIVKKYSDFPLQFVTTLLIPAKDTKPEVLPTIAFAPLVQIGT